MLFRTCETFRGLKPTYFIKVSWNYIVYTVTRQLLDTGFKLVTGSVLLYEIAVPKFNPNHFTIASLQEKLRTVVLFGTSMPRCALLSASRRATNNFGANFWEGTYVLLLDALWSHLQKFCTADHSGSVAIRSQLAKCHEESWASTLHGR
jgi:hypothetical protein